MPVQASKIKDTRLPLLCGGLEKIDRLSPLLAVRFVTLSNGRKTSNWLISKSINLGKTEEL